LLASLAARVYPDSWFEFLADRVKTPPQRIPGRHVLY
jgi:hypothetical protein